MAKSKISKKAPGFTRQVNFWMRPVVRKLLDHMATDREVSIQELVDTIVCREAGREDLLIGRRADAPEFTVLSHSTDVRLY